MITEDGKLQVFEDFRVDDTLPKFNDDNEADESMGAEDVTFNVSPARWRRRRGRIVMSSGEVLVEGEPLAPAIKRRGPLTWLKGLFARKELEITTYSVQEFFTHVKNSGRELHIVAERAVGYERAIKNAQDAGQLALLEQLQGGLNAHRMEAQLVAIGLTKYVTEDDVVRFYRQSKRGLRLDWVRNFTRVIPEEIVALKRRADELGAFDNYAVMHYDPESKAFAETQEEKAARRDPILFGLMKDRRVLYVVGDWVDEVCDLTLDQFADAVGASAVKEL